MIGKLKGTTRRGPGNHLIFQQRWALAWLQIHCVSVLHDMISPTNWKGVLTIADHLCLTQTRWVISGLFNCGPSYVDEYRKYSFTTNAIVSNVCM